jgi:hypothetical protein
LQSKLRVNLVFLIENIQVKAKVAISSGYLAWLQVNGKNEDSPKMLSCNSSEKAHIKTQGSAEPYDQFRIRRFINNCLDLMRNGNI